MEIYKLNNHNVGKISEELQSTEWELYIPTIQLRRTEIKYHFLLEKINK